MPHLGPHVISNEERNLLLGGTRIWCGIPALQALPFHFRCFCGIDRLGRMVLIVEQTGIRNTTFEKLWTSDRGSREEPKQIGKPDK